ncbi:MAG: ABC transporter permease subunit, partial [bacterium]
MGVNASALPRAQWWRRVSIIDLYLWGFRLAVLVVVVWGTVGTLRAGQYSGEVWLDFMVFGLSQGAIYALIALGYTMVYGILRMINFAHGEIFMSGAYTAYFFADALDRAGFFDRHPIISLLIVL